MEHDGTRPHRPARAVTHKSLRAARRFTPCRAPFVSPVRQRRRRGKIRAFQPNLCWTGCINCDKHTTTKQVSQAVADFQDLQTDLPTWKITQEPFSAIVHVGVSVTTDRKDQHSAFSWAKLLMISAPTHIKTTRSTMDQKSDGLGLLG